jgi:monofunctional biosynthetic peptidoglycan transglycosylase
MNDRAGLDQLQATHESSLQERRVTTRPRREAAPPLQSPMARPSLRPGWQVRRILANTARLVILALLAMLLVAAVWLLMIAAYRSIDPPGSTLMLGRRLIGAPVTQQPLPLARMSPHLIRAVVLAEDGRFCRHAGVDWAAIDEALEQAEEGARPRGASTIPMQTVKNLLLWPQAHYVRKALEVPLAYVADAWWGKARTLELYLNAAEWAPGVFGAEAAAQYHFRKRAADIGPREAALLAVSLPNPVERVAGNPGPGTIRLAQRLEARVARAGNGPTSCVLAGR